MPSVEQEIRGWKEAYERECKHTENLAEQLRNVRNELVKVKEKRGQLNKVMLAIEGICKSPAPNYGRINLMAAQAIWHDEH